MFFPLMRERRFSIWMSPPDTWRLLSFFLFFFFGEVIKRDRWKGAEWIQMKSFALLLSAAIRLLQIWLWGVFFVSFSVCLRGDCLRPEEMFDVIIQKNIWVIRLRSVPADSNRAKAWEKLWEERVWSACWEIQSCRWTFDIGRNIFMDWWHCPADQCCTSMFFFFF